MGEALLKSVLLAEDNPEHCFFFRRALKEVAPEASFVAVHDGDSLMGLLENYLPDLLFLDLGMPRKNGVQCIKEIRENKAYDSLPVIVFSISDDSHVIQVAYGYGANLYIVKPQEYGLLKSSLDRVLSMDWNVPADITGQHFYEGRYLPFAIS